MYSESFAPWLSWPRGPYLGCQRLLGGGLIEHNKRHFAYYRFHKKLGKGNWNRYIERYTKPRSIENTQGIIFNYRASFQAAKNSASYLWELPKRIASATSSNDVLDAWVYFRHKRKKAYHFILALKRLAEINDLDTSDWRFQLIQKKLLKRSKYFIDLPKVCSFLGSLKAIPTLDKLSIQLCENIDRYTTSQLALIAEAFGNCRLHSKHLFSLISKQLDFNINLASNEDLISIADAFGKCMIYNYGTLGLISLELQKRLSNEVTRPAVHSDMYTLPNRHCMANIRIPATANIGKPSLGQLISLVEAFAAAKYRDTVMCDLLSQMIRSELSLRNHKDAMDPNLVTRVVRAYSSLKVNDIPLAVSVLDNMTEHPYNYPPKCISEIGMHLTRLLPRQLKSIHEKYNNCLKEIRPHLSRMDARQLTNTAIFVYKAETNTGRKAEFLAEISDALAQKRDGTVKYDAPKMLEVLSMHNSLTEEAFNLLCRDIYRVVSLFEPVDYQRTARTMRKLKKANLTNIKMVNMLTKHVINHYAEFQEFQYHCIARDLTLAGPPQQTLLRDLWSHNRYKKGFSPALDSAVTTTS